MNTFGLGKSNVFPSFWLGAIGSVQRGAHEIYKFVLRIYDKVVITLQR